jgi:ATP-binding cassette, subfamily F, member 3
MMVIHTIDARERNAMLQVSNISKHYGDIQVLKGVSFTINQGDRVGLIGPNGCGKTTLMRILVGEELPDTGAIALAPVAAPIGYLAQGLPYGESDTLDDVLRQEERELAQAEAEVARLASALADAEGKAQERLLTLYGEALARMVHLAEGQTAAHEVVEVLAGLDLDHLSLDTPVSHLSGGQKTRLGLARLLVRKPRMLLLDEPTNHLDIGALEWLEEWLLAYEGAAIIVSHDRAFLNRTTIWTFELSETTHELTAYPGNYDDYLAAKQREIERQWDAYNAQQERIAQLTGESRRLSGYANSIEHGTIDFAPRKIAKGIARRATVQRRRIERELAQEHVERPRLSWQMKLAFTDTPESGQDVLILDKVAIGYVAAQPLVTGIEQTLRQGERIALVGPNGTGKTTLLRAINGEIAPLEGTIKIGTNVRIGYYAQEQENLDPESTPFDTLRQVAAMSDTEVRSFLHYFLFTGDEVFVRVRNLSFGERARLILARLVAGGCNLLLLDEPINHLDIPSRAGFEQAMTAFEGTVLAVVHDRYFIDAFATRLWAIHDGELRTYADLDDYQRIRRRQANARTARDSARKDGISEDSAVPRSPEPE